MATFPLKYFSCFSHQKVDASKVEKKNRGRVYFSRLTAVNVYLGIMLTAVNVYLGIMLTAVNVYLGIMSGLYQPFAFLAPSLSRASFAQTVAIVSSIDCLLISDETKESDLRSRKGVQVDKTEGHNMIYFVRRPFENSLYKILCLTAVCQLWFHYANSKTQSFELKVLLSRALVTSKCGCLLMCTVCATSLYC